MKIYAGYPSHSDYETITITTNIKEVKNFSTKESKEASLYSFIYWNDESVDIASYSSLENLINEVSVGYHGFVAAGDIDEKEYNYETEKFTQEGLKQAWRLLKKYTNDSEPDGDSSAGSLILKNTTIIAGNSDYYDAGEGITVKNETITENKEKQLTIELLTEKLQRISGKKVVLSEAKVGSKDWERMLDIVLKGGDGKGVASTITNKDKAISRFVAGLKLKGEDINISQSGLYYNGSFSEFGDKALKLGATPQEIQTTFDTTTVPSQFAQKQNDLSKSDKGLRGSYTGPLANLLLKMGLDYKFSKGGNAITRMGKDAMSRNGRKWTIGYKVEIIVKGKPYILTFDAVTDEGDGPTSYVIDDSTPKFVDASWKYLGQREFLLRIKEGLEKI